MVALGTGVRIVLALAVFAAVLVACDRTDSAPTEPLVATGVPATHVSPADQQLTATPTATRIPADASPIATATSVPTQSSRVEVSPLLSDEQAAAVPAACTPEMLRTLFEQLVERYNTGDVDSIVALMQPEQGDPALAVANGATPFQGYGWGNDPAALTHAELRAALPSELAEGYTLRLSHVQYGPSVDTRLPGGPPSTRNANVSVEMQRWIDPAYPHSFSGKGIVDCASGRIIVLAGGPGPHQRMAFTPPAVATADQ